MRPMAVTAYRGLRIGAFFKTQAVDASQISFSFICQKESQLALLFLMAI